MLIGQIAIKDLENSINLDKWLEKKKRSRYNVLNNSIKTVDSIVNGGPYQGRLQDYSETFSPKMKEAADKVEYNRWKRESNHKLDDYVRGVEKSYGDGKKDSALIAAGIAGLAGLGYGGYKLYKHFKNKKEEKENQYKDHRVDKDGNIIDKDGKIVLTI